MRDHHGAAHPEQGRAAVALGVETGVELAQPAALQQRADPGAAGSGERAAKLAAGEAQRALEGLEGDVAGEPVGDDHVHHAGHEVSAFDVAREVDRQRARRRLGGQQLMGPAGEHVALARLGADSEQPHLGGGDPQGYLGVGGAELPELDEHLGLGVGGGPGVDEDRGVGMGRQQHGDAGSRHARQGQQPVPGGGDDRAGGAGRHDRARLAAPDELAGHGDAGPRPAEAGQRPLVHADDVLGGDDAQFRSGPEPGDHRAKPPGRPGQQDGDVVLALRGERPGDDLARGVVPAHRVDRDHRVPAGPQAQLRVSGLVGVTRRIMVHVVRCSLCPPEIRAPHYR